MSRSPKGIAAIRPTVAGQRLTRRQRDAVLAIARSHELTDGQLRRVVGRYATNAVKALERRDLIAYQIPLALEPSAEGSWILTERGHQLVQDLADARRPE